ncbi:MAG: 3'-5' exonuclease [Anaerolineae bacterium]|nr:3'-5' exonuclease [Anaerolineae bacterium]
MIRSVPAHVWAFDLEWAPDLASGRRACNLSPDTPDDEVYAAMWAAGGATPEEPRPYLKTMLCRIVSMAVVIRKAQDDAVSLTLFSLPAGEVMPERDLIGRFLRGIGDATPKPQLVGYNSREADVPILIQRGIAQGVSAPGFAHRPDKPWDGYDYFSKNSEGHVDLKDVIGGWGRATPKLHEFAAACGIPGKIDTTGDNVIDLWLAGDVRAIVEYNEFDALTTYLLWLRTAHFAGHFSDEAHAAEVERVRDLLRKRIADGQTHLERYMAKWAAMADGKGE